MTTALPFGGTWSREHTFAVSAAAVLSFAFVGILAVAGREPRAVVLLPALAVLLVLLSSVPASLVSLVVCLFVDVHVGSYSSAVVFAYVLALGVLWHRRNVPWEEFGHPLLKPIVVYGLCILPSFLNAEKPLTSLAMLTNVGAFLIALSVVQEEARTWGDIRRLAGWFLAFGLANALNVIVLAMLGENRPFGFAGIMYVDYAGLGLSVSAAASIVSRGRSRRAFALVAFVLAVALVLTQTRSIWLAALATLAVLAGYVLAHPGAAGMARREVIRLAAAGAVALVVAWAAIVALSPQIEQRATQLADRSGFQIDNSGSTSSLVTRLFIWHTAFNAFREHPLFGIGVYAFPYSSKSYYTLPRLFYDPFVKGNSPHQTHLAVLAETGLVGAAGFLVFILALLRMAFRTIAMAASPEGRGYAIVGATAIVYCCFSMIVTDAWLWGQGIVLLGLCAGVVAGIGKLNGAAGAGGSAA